MILIRRMMLPWVLLLVNCSSNDSSSPDSTPSADAEGISMADFDTSKVPSLDEAGLTSALTHLSPPDIPNFSNSATLLTQENKILLSKNLPIYDLADSFGQCIDNTPAVMDQVTAGGATARGDIKYDWSQCLKDSLTQGGIAVTTSQCTVSYRMETSCPGKDFTQANGKKLADAATFLGMGVSDCKLQSGIKGTVKAQMLLSCSFTGTLNGAPVSLNTLTRSGFFDASGGACPFSTDGSQNILGDCIDAYSFAEDEVKASTPATSERAISRYRLNGAKINYRSPDLVSGQSMGFNINNWSGTVTTGAGSASYKVSNGTTSKTGQIYP